MILSQLVINQQPNWSEVIIDGIKSITQEQIEQAENGDNVLNILLKFLLMTTL